MARLTFDRVPALDGFRLAVAYFDPFCRTDSRRVVVINAGAGIPKTFYAPFATWLADHGLSVVLYDYRGIGESRGESIRGLRANIEDWGSKDCAGVLGAIRARYPQGAISVLGHSIGSIVTGFVKEPPKIERMLLVSPHTGYSGDYAFRAKPGMFLQWHAIMPFATYVVGYFPGRFFGLPEDLPYDIALQWAKRRFPWNTNTDAVHGVFRQIASTCLVIRPQDDPFATQRAAARVRANFPNVHFFDHLLRLVPGDRAIGHFGFFHPRSRDSAWVVARDWFRDSNEAKIE